jgi:hypothetical protein
MDRLIPLLIPALLSCVLGIITALITTSYKLKRQLHIDKVKEYERIRIKYLHPLLVAAQDLTERIADIRRRRKNENEKIEMMGWFRNIKVKIQTESFYYWANDEGYFAMSSLYMTAVYFAYATKIRREFPFIELKSGDNIALLNHIKAIRISIGGKFGIWEIIQDSLGSYLLNKTDETVKTYKEFCLSINDQSETIWYNRLIDFFRDVDKKLEDQLGNIESSLKSLIDFLSVSLRIKRTKLRLTEDTINNLRGITELKNLMGEEKFNAIIQEFENIPKKIKHRGFNSESDLFIFLADLIGQNNVDDLKPSILRFARKIKI